MDNGEPNSTYDSIENLEVAPTFDEFDDYINNLHSITPQIFSSTHNLLVNKHTALREQQLMSFHVGTQKADFHMIQVEE